MRSGLADRTERRPPIGNERVYGRVLIVDEGKCDGCLLCALACAVAHTGGTDLQRAHMQIHRLAEAVFVPLTCHHCETPTCAEACPTKACRKDDETQRVVIDGSRCIGCRTCVVACPFGHAHYDRAARVSSKCDYCDGEPECARVCPAQAIAYVYSDESSQHKKAESAAVRASLRGRW